MKLNFIILFIFSFQSTYIFSEESCPEGYNRQFNGPCIPNASAQETINVGRECRELPEGEQEQCFNRLASEASSRSGNGDYDTSELGNGGQGAIHAAILVAAASSLDFLIKKKNRKIGCGRDQLAKTPMSIIGITAGAATLLGAEVISYIKYSGKLAELNNDLSEFQTPETDDPDTSKDQYYDHLTELAFDSIIKKEEAYLAATKVRQTGYLIAGSIFTAAGVMAVIEGALKFKDSNDKYVCGAPTGGIATDPSSSSGKSSGGGGGSQLLMLMLPTLLGFVVDSGVDMHMPENLIHNIHQLDLPRESKRLLSSLKDSRSIEEFNMIMKESERLAQGEVSSPGVAEFNSLKETQEIYNNQTNWQDQKQMMIMGTLLTSQYEEFGFLFSSNEVALK